MCTVGYFRLANDPPQNEHLCKKYSNWAVICTRGSITYSLSHFLSEHVHRRLFPLCKWSATETTFVSFPIYKLPHAPAVIFATQSPITEQTIIGKKPKNRLLSPFDLSYALAAMLHYALTVCSCDRTIPQMLCYRKNTLNKHLLLHPAPVSLWT
jgi:hypothetical protein